MNKYKPVKYEHLLGSVFKPSRYINNEINSFHKTPSETKVNFCLTFPDVYEVGFSHLGLKILYTILNTNEDCMADRAFTPWPDFADKLKSENIPLFAIESKIPLKNFDVVGFTLQTELTYTNILYTLEAANIPIWSKDREEEDPIILGGGPTSTNPKPLADFFDAFLIGDGEEAILEIKQVLFETKGKSRATRIQALDKVKGIYLPHFKQNKVIQARKYMKLSDDAGHENQLVPWTEPTHYRYVSEIMRGCSRGCRFCHAGMFYRPVREKKPEHIIKNLLREIDQYGWSEASLSSLSSSDYSCIKEILLQLFKELSKRKTSLSLPSLRVDSLDEQIIKLLNALRQSGLTIAPEAGSQRLRDIINKNISEEEILEGVKIAMDNGWRLIKLYFMIGLPYEIQEDIEGIIQLVNTILDLAKHRIKINITISPFVPKSFTPFQWAGMNSKEVLKDKATHVKNYFKKNRNVKISYHEIQTSQLECILGRGDRNVSTLIYEAYLNGAKFDGWSEYWDFSNWQKAIDKIGFNWDGGLMEIPIQNELFWDNIDIGIDKKFLLNEWKKASEEKVTEDCRNGKCSACGICTGNVKNIFQTKSNDLNIEFPEISKIQIQQKQWIYRVFYAKLGVMRFVSHLDLTRMTQNFLRASKLPLIYSQGYNIHPKLNFGPPLSIGVEGEKEYFDIYLTERTDIAEIRERLNEYFPVALKLDRIVPVTKKEMLAMEYYNLEKVSVYPEEKYYKRFEEGLNDYNSREEWIFTRVRKGKERSQDLKQKIHRTFWIDGKLTVIKEKVGASIFDFIEQVFGIERDNTDRFRIVREEMFREEN